MLNGDSIITIKILRLVWDFDGMAAYHHFLNGGRRVSNFQVGFEWQGQTDLVMNTHMRSCVIFIPTHIRRLAKMCWRLFFYFIFFLYCTHCRKHKRGSHTAGHDQTQRLAAFPLSCLFTRPDGELFPIIFQFLNWHMQISLSLKAYLKRHIRGNMYLL